MIALIITIIVMIILVAVSVTVALKGGLFKTAKNATSSTQIELEKEQLLSAAIGAIGPDGKVDYAKLDANLPEGFTGSNGTYTSKTGNKYEVEKNGTVTYVKGFDAEEWDKTVSSEDCFLWASDTPGEEGYGTIVGYTEKAQGNTKLRIPSRCTKIEYPSGYNSSDQYGEQRAFLEGIEKLEIPGTLSVISNEAFHGGFYFKNLKEVYIEEGVTSIGDSFWHCANLTTITIPESVTSIDSWAFADTAWYNNQPDGLIYIGKVAYKYKGEMPSNTTIEIKEGSKGIAGSAFYQCENLTKVVIPKSVTNIGGGAFGGCLSLETITIPDGVTNIGATAFSGCTNLKTITLPDGMTSIERSIFENCTALTEITIPDSVTNIESGAFKRCLSLETITIPDGVTNIRSYTFEDCTSLKEIRIPDSLTIIEHSAFKRCLSLEMITIPDGVTSIEFATFMECRNLKTITIPNTVTTIEDSAFFDCTSLETITIPDGVTRIEVDAFSGCTNLETIYLEAESVPSTWDSNWKNNCNANVVYGYKGE